MKKYIFIMCVCCFCSCDFFLSGSYSKAEYYKLNISENDFVAKINGFKDRNPNYKLTKSQKIGDSHDGLDDRGLYYSVYFYFDSKNITMHCIIPVNESKSVIGLDAVSEGVNFASWERVNTDELTKERNTEIKKIFETEILNQLGEWE